MTIVVRPLPTPRSLSRSPASAVTQMTESANAADTRSWIVTSRTAGCEPARSKRVANSSGNVSWTLRITFAPRSFGASAQKVSMSGMLCASTTSKRRVRSSAVTLRSAPRKKRPYPLR